MEKRVKTVRVENPGWMFYLTSKLTNHQKYYVMILIVISAFLLVIWGILQITSERLGELNGELAVNNLERPYRLLYEHVDQHRTFTQLYKGNERAIRSDIRRLETLIQQDLEQILEHDTLLSEFYQLHGDSLRKQGGFPERGVQLESFWQKIKEANQKEEATVSAPLYTSFLNALSSSMQNLEMGANPTDQGVVGRYLLSEIYTSALPKMIKSIEENDQLEILYYLRMIQQLGRKYMVGGLGDEELSSFAKSFNLFEQTVERALQEKGGAQEKMKEAVAEFQMELEKNEWLLLSENLGKYEPSSYILLGTSIITLLVGILMGKFFVDRTVDSVRFLHFGYSRLNEGDLKVRIPVFFDDEIGRATVGFNLMAEELDFLISKQRELLQATKRLAGGDFSTRVPEELGDEEHEVNELVRAFNRLAETFDQIMSRIARLSVQLDTSSDEVSDASKRYEESTESQEKITQHLLQTSIQISSNAREYAATMSEVTLVVEEAAMLASRNQEQLKRMGTIMNDMVDASADIASKLGILNDKTANINSVLTTIISVADQTNLLSLNAAIIAERAERYGESFVVIASEIRNLAELTANATLEIEQIIAQMMRAVSESVMGVDDFIQEIRDGAKYSNRIASQLEKIIEEVQKLVPRFEFVNDGMKIQSDASRLIHEAIAKLSKKAHLTTESMHQFVVTSEELKESASYLSQTIAKMGEEG